MIIPDLIHGVNGHGVSEVIDRRQHVDELREQVEDIVDWLELAKSICIQSFHVQIVTQFLP